MSNKQPISTFLGIAAAVVLAAGLAGPVQGGATCSVEPQPTSPTVIITLGGLWHDSCVPNGSQATVSGNTVFFDIFLNYPPDIFCLFVLTPWELSETVGPLAAGGYTVVATFFEDGFVIGGPTPVCEFIFEPPPEDCNDFPCGNNVLLCHVPPGKPENAHTLCISPKAVAAHLESHPGDHCGPCDGPLLHAEVGGGDGVLPCPTDINGDGSTNVLDLIDLLLCFGLPAVPGCEAEDVNGDGVTNVLDLIDLLLAFGQACP